MTLFLNRVTVYFCVNYTCHVASTNFIITRAATDKVERSLENVIIPSAHAMLLTMNWLSR